MKIEEIKRAKARAHQMGLEFITDRDGDVCIRPMHFDGDGRREVRYQPDPCEFKDPAEIENQEATIRLLREQCLDVLVEPIGRAEEQIALQPP